MPAFGNMPAIIVLYHQPCYVNSEWCIDNNDDCARSEYSNIWRDYYNSRPTRSA